MQVVQTMQRSHAIVHTKESVWQRCGLLHISGVICLAHNVATPLLEECEDDTHTPEMGTWESFETPKTSKFDCRSQNTLP
jgi:hypothetical protein